MGRAFGVHSEHDLKEQSDAQIIVSRFTFRWKSGAARIGGGERSEPITRVLIMPYDTESQSRNADFILIAR